eukprot:CAMPEP_0197884594 /NCGR_PEP_ID=MMETSP1439-20131203/10992_1 /TAXON_ID=66791 /ORGANISM="Gonyaulax spinifera, Strain CCMP409" /LENGTH=96 /DNA_ID=CAMNT_0043504331 /DNA_START=51 /DNA_END=337 /DNA_ORIENTATION=+
MDGHCGCQLCPAKTSEHHALKLGHKVSEKLAIGGEKRCQTSNKACTLGSRPPENLEKAAENPRPPNVSPRLGDQGLGPPPKSLGLAELLPLDEGLL